MGTQTTQLAATNIAERVMVMGDLSQLSAQERISYYAAVCKSIGLNPLTKPFDYITLNGKLTLYAKKDATDQLRKINDVSIEKPEITFQDDLIIVTIAAHDKNGRSDSDIGVVKKSDMRGDTANALMKAVTKAKRRVTLSLCGLGWLDETEIEAIPEANPAIVTEYGEIVDAQVSPAPKPQNGKQVSDLQISVNAWQDAKARALKIGGLDDTIRKYRPASDCKDPQVINAAAAALQTACDAIAPPVS